MLVSPGLRSCKSASEPYDIFPLIISPITPKNREQGVYLSALFSNVFKQKNIATGLKSDCINFTWRNAHGSKQSLSSIVGRILITEYSYTFQ